MTRASALARTLVELADTLVDDFDVVDLLTTLSERCVDVLDADAAGIMLVAPDGELRVMASSSAAMRTVELFELQSQEGPCLDCFRSGKAVVEEDLAMRGRWPRFAPVAMGAGFRAVEAIPMRLRHQLIGALNLFRTGAGSLGEEDLKAAQALADGATIAILQHRTLSDATTLNVQLEHALTSRVLIEQAKGILAERACLGVHEAFMGLRTYARNHNRRLADVALDVVEGRFRPPI